MAEFICKVQDISRKQGRSAVSASAYRSGDKLENQYTGETIDYRQKRFIEKSEILLPQNAPEAWKDREKLWNAVEAAEKAKDARLSQEIMFAIPRELDRKSREKLVYDFCKDLADHGMIIDYSIHNPPMMDDLKRPVDKDGHPTDDPKEMIFNPHVHIMIPLRPVGPDGKFTKKTQIEYVCKDIRTGKYKNCTPEEYRREQLHLEKLYPCNKDGKRIYLTKAEIEQQGLKRISRFPKTTKFGRMNQAYAYRSSGKFVEDLRESWEKYANQTLEKAGFEARIDHRSYKEQGVAKIPQKHMGQQVTQMERRARRLETEGKPVPENLRSDIAALNREIRKHNHMVDLYSAQLAKADTYAKQLAAIRAAWVSEKCHNRKLEEYIRKISAEKDALETRIEQYRKSEGIIKSSIVATESKLKEIKEQLASLRPAQIIKKSALKKELQEAEKQLAEEKAEFSALRKSYGYEDERKPADDEALLKEIAKKLDEAEKKYQKSRENEKSLHERYFEVKKLVPVKVKKIVYERESAYLRADTAAFVDAIGQLFISVSYMIKREIEEYEYREERAY